MKFTINQEEKEEYLVRNIQFPKELFDKINNIKGEISLNKFVVQAVEYAIDNMEDN